MPTDLPALTRLTEDVVAAMHTAEQRQRRHHGWRRGLPLLAVLIALGIPAALIPSAGDDAGDHAPPPAPNQDHAYNFATAASACGIGAGTIAITALALRAGANGAGARLGPCT